MHEGRGQGQRREQSQYGQSQQYGQAQQYGQSQQYGQGQQGRQRGREDFYGQGGDYGQRHSNQEQRSWREQGDQQDDWQQQQRGQQRGMLRESGSQQGGMQGYGQESQRQQGGWNRSSSGRSDSNRSDEARERSQRGNTDPEAYYQGTYRRSTQPYSYEGGSGYLTSESLTMEGPYSGPHSGKGPKGYKRSNEQIIQDVSDRLERNGEIDASEIEVTCEDGVVTLTGEVDERSTKRRAEEVAHEVYGVNDVMNQLRVNKGFFSRMFGSSSDSESRDESSRQERHVSQREGNGSGDEASRNQPLKLGEKRMGMSARGEAGKEKRPGEKN